MPASVPHGTVRFGFGRVEPAGTGASSPEAQFEIAAKASWSQAPGQADADPTKRPVLAVGDDDLYWVHLLHVSFFGCLPTGFTDPATLGVLGIIGSIVLSPVLPTIRPDLHRQQILVKSDYCGHLCAAA